MKALLRDILFCLCYFASALAITAIHIYYASSYTGETFQVLVLAVGRRNGTVHSTVRSIIQYPHQTEVDLKEDHAP